MNTGKPELSDGYLRIANELHEAISRAKFTQYERSLIDLILRLSYGCKQSLVADVLHWSDLKVVGIPKQHARSTAENLKDKKVIKITYPSGRIRFRLNKYYLQWKVQFDNNDKLFSKLITLNTDYNKPLEDSGNTSVTKEENGHTSVTFEDGGHTSVTKKVTPVLPESNTSVTESGDKPAKTQGLSEPKETKERRKKNTPQKNVISGPVQGIVERTKEVGVFSQKDVREKSRDRSKEVGYIQDMIMDAFNPQLKAVPPYTECQNALDRYGFDILEAAAIEARGMALENPTPQSALNYVIAIAKNGQSGLNYEQRSKIAGKLKKLRKELLDAEADTDLSHFRDEDKDGVLAEIQADIDRFEQAMEGK